MPTIAACRAVIAPACSAGHGDITPSWRARSCLLAVVVLSSLLLLAVVVAVVL